MPFGLTESIRALIERDGEPDAETFAVLWDALRRALVYEMRKRSLWNSSPSYLGIRGANSWQEGDALEEILTECFAFSVLKRLERLGEHLKVKANIDGLIFINIRNFLTNTQMKHDRMGYKAFKVLQEATKRSIVVKALHVLEGDDAVRNDTVLGFSADSNPGLFQRPLRPYVEGWGNDLLPGLLNARGKKQEILRTLEGHIAGLGSQGVEVFRFKDVVTPFKEEMRELWRVMSASSEEELGYESEGEGAKVVRIVRPQTDIEQDESLRELVACVGASIDKLEERERTKAYLKRLWEFLSNYATDDEDDKLPAAVQLSKRLEIPRERFRGLYATLARLAAACKAAASSSSVIREGGIAVPGRGNGGIRAMSRSTPQEQNRKKLEEALVRLKERQATTQNRGDEAPRPGDRYLFVKTAAFPVEWAVVERDSEEPGYLRVIPTDSHPLIGSADVAVPAEALCGPLSLRCGFEVRLTAEEFDPELRLGSLEPEHLDRVRCKCAEIKRGELSATAEEQEVDGEPEYEDWRKQVLAQAQAALGEESSEESERVSGELVTFPFRRWWNLASPYLVAASICGVVTLGLGHKSLRQQVADLRQRLAVSNLKDPVAGLPITWFNTLRTNRAEKKTITVPATASHVLLMVDVNDPEPYPAYRLVIGEEGSETSWSSGELPRIGVDEVSAVVPRGLLPEGEYPFRIYGVRNSQSQLVANYTLQVFHE